MFVVFPSLVRDCSIVKLYGIKKLKDSLFFYTSGTSKLSFNVYCSVASGKDMTLYLERNIKLCFTFLEVVMYLLKMLFHLVGMQRLKLLYR